MAVIAFGAHDRKPQHFQHAGVALVEIERDDLGIAIDAQRQLRQIIGADRETVEQLGECVDADDIVGNFAHDVDFKAVLARASDHGSAMVSITRRASSTRRQNGTMTRSW